MHETHEQRLVQAFHPTRGADAASPPRAEPPADAGPEAAGPLTRLAAGALIVGQVALVPFALWHGSLETPDAETTLSVVQGSREGWYWLHYGTLACLFATALGLVGLTGWAAGRRRGWATAAALLLVVSLLNLGVAFGTEAVGYYYLTQPGLVDAEAMRSYLDEVMFGGHYGVLIGTGLLAFTLGGVSAVRVLAVARTLPLLLRRLLPVAVVLDFVKLTPPLEIGGPMAVVAAAIWIALGVCVLRALARPRSGDQAPG